MSDIAQLDGNDSILSDSDATRHISNKPEKTTSAQCMPVVATYTMRSLFPNAGNLKKDILERNIQVAFCVNYGKNLRIGCINMKLKTCWKVGA